MIYLKASDLSILKLHYEAEIHRIKVRCVSPIIDGTVCGSFGDDDNNTILFFNQDISLVDIYIFIVGRVGKIHCYPTNRFDSVLFFSIVGISCPVHLIKEGEHFLIFDLTNNLQFAVKVDIIFVCLHLDVWTHLHHIHNF